MRLHPDDIEAIADAILARLDGEELLPHPRRRYVDASELAQEIGMSPAWVYRNQILLGAERRGTGPKPRLRFDVERARTALAAQRTNTLHAYGDKRRPGRPRRTERQSYAGPLLPIRGLTGPDDAATVASQNKAALRREHAPGHGTKEGP